VLVDEDHPVENKLAATDPWGSQSLVQVDVEIANQNLDHSVAILGWGKDPKSGMKVWIARNSFGPKWGERGDFYIRRG
jgi:C1A family cysteine protease